MKLYELTKGDLFKVDASGYETDIFEFDHVDGMYSYCTVKECPNNPEQVGYVAHLAAYAPVIKLPSSSG